MQDDIRCDILRVTGQIDSGHDDFGNGFSAAPKQLRNMMFQRIALNPGSERGTF